MKKINNLKDVKNLMKLSMYCGELLIKYGAEIYRAEDTVYRICNSVENLKSIDAYVLPTGIFISCEYDSEVITLFKKVYPSYTSLKKINLLNSFSRDFVRDKISIKEGFEILSKIDETPKDHILKVSLFTGFAGAFFSVLYGGNINDFIAAYIITFLVVVFLEKISIFKLTFFINNFLGAFIISMLAIIFTRYGIGSNSDMIIIGSIMILVPGVAATNAIRDIMNGDILSGQMGLTKAIFIALAIAIGVGVALRIFM